MDEFFAEVRRLVKIPVSVKIGRHFSNIIGMAEKLKAGGAAFTLQAEARDSTGVQRVEFWMDDLLVGERLSAPFTFPWQPLPGSHTLVIKAYDLAGNPAESAQLTFTVE